MFTSVEVDIDNNISLRGVGDARSGVHADQRPYARLQLSAAWMFGRPNKKDTDQIDLNTAAQ